ncbi:MAG: 50S ribosomal protein L3 [Gemmatimonadota bacterium]
MKAIIGKKLGMTQVFDDEGNAVPVTVVEAGPCPVVQVKDVDSDGYHAVQIGFGEQKAKRTTRAEAGHAQKAGLEATPRTLKEFRLSEPGDYEAGQQLTVEQFEAGDTVKITGTTRGRGFQGVVKRYGFKGRPATHGHPGSRVPGSMGPGTDPSRVIKGKKLPGQMGNVRHSERSCRVVRVDGERNLLFIRGGLPGSRNSVLFIREA